MRIVYFVRDISDCGGIQQTTCQGINSLLEKKKNYSIAVISLFQKNESSFFDLCSVVQRVSLFQKAVDTKKDFFKIKHQLKKVLKAQKSDVLVVQGTAFTVYIPQFIWKQTKVIVCEHGHYYMGGKFGLHWWGKRKALKKADAIVTLTNLDAENYRKENCRNILITNIYNSCGKEEFDPKYDVNSKTIISCGSLDLVKRFDHVIEAARIIFNKVKDWKWYIYGDGVQRTSLQQKIDEYDLKDNVILKGYEKNKREIYGEKSFLVLTSQFEGFGMVMIEAFKYKLPVVAYDVDYGPKEIIQNEKNGIVVENGNIDALAKYILELINNSEKRKSMSENAFRSIKLFSIEKISEEWISLFEQIVEEGK